jgi:hypothetical protein
MTFKSSPLKPLNQIKANLAEMVPFQYCVRQPHPPFKMAAVTTFTGIAKLNTYKVKNKKIQHCRNNCKIKYQNCWKRQNLFALKFELKWSLGGPLSKLRATPPFSINLRCQIENQVSDFEWHNIERGPPQPNLL